MSDRVVITTIEEAIRLADEWAEAYRELHREFLRLQERCEDAQWWAEHHEFMRRQEALLARHPAPKRRSPFDEPAEVA